MPTFDTEKAIKLYKEGYKIKEIENALDVKGSTLRMFFSKSIKEGKIESRLYSKRKFVRKKLKEVRKKRELSQQVIADQIGITRSGYSNIENFKRNPSYATVKKIKDVLKYYDDDLFEFELEQNLGLEVRKNLKKPNKNKGGCNGKKVFD